MRLSTVAGVVGSGGVGVPAEVSYLVIAGAGGGGHTSNGFDGGGGAGGYRSSWNSEASGAGSSAESPIVPTAGTSYTVTVGAGGAKNAVGGNSVFATITSVGGGDGGRYNSTHGGASGGSGGGSGGRYNSAADPGNGTANQGRQGGYGGGLPTVGAGVAGGGGGAAGSHNVQYTNAIFTGGNGTYRNVGGRGNTGQNSTITGSAVTRAGGGGGAPSGAGQDGGGNAGTHQTGGGSGSVNSGSGGGAGGGNSGSGGSGIVVLRFAGASPTIGAGLTYTETTDGDDTILTFTAGSDTISW